VSLKVFSQLPYAENGLIDDCGPSALAAAIFHSSKGALNPGVAACIAAAAKAGRVDRFGKSDGTTFVQIVAAGKSLGATLVPAGSWEKAVAAMSTGRAVVVAFRAPLATPRNALSAWQRGNAKRHPGHSYGHLATMAIVDGKFIFADPTMSGKGAEEFGKEITAEEAKVIGQWGIGVENARRKNPMVWIVTTKVVASVPAPVVEPTPKVVPVVAPVAKPSPAPVASLDEALDARIAAPAPKPRAQGRGYDEELAALGRVDWGNKANEAGKVLGSALAATEKVKGTMGKLKAGIVYIIANTGIDEAIIEAVRVGLSTGIAVMLATGAPILDMTTEDFRVVGSGAIAATLQVLVRALNPDDPKFGVGKLKATREAAEKAARVGTRAK